MNNPYKCPEDSTSLLISDIKKIFQDSQRVFIEDQIRYHEAQILYYQNQLRKMVDGQNQ